MVNRESFLLYVHPSVSFFPSFIVFYLLLLPSYHSSVLRHNTELGYTTWHSFEQTEATQYLCMFPQKWCKNNVTYTVHHYTNTLEKQNVGM
jgi:hypothetical protein